MKKTSNQAPEQPQYEVQIKYEKNNSTYRPEDVVSGHITVFHADGSDARVDVNSLNIKVVGGITTQNRNNNKQLEAILAKSEKIVFLEHQQKELVKNKTLTSKDKVFFKFKLQQNAYKMLETYIGVYISINYEVSVEVKLYNGIVIKNEIPFYVQVNQAGREAIDNFTFPKPKPFMITSADIAGDPSKIPKFKIKGEIVSEICQFVDDFNGWLEIDQAETPIRSIDLQMLRCEKIENAAGRFMEKTEIQLIQVCDGNVTRNIQIPIYMIFPRYFSCPSVRYKDISVDFEVNLVVIFRDGFKVTVNLPIKIFRN